MREAVVRVDVDPQRALPVGEVACGVARLQQRGVLVLRKPSERELELVLDSTDAEDARQRTRELCESAFGTAPALGAVTFISRGSDEDALGVVAAFGVRAHLRRAQDGDAEVAIFTLDPADRRRVPESRLHTALEAALNCEVRIVYG
jgi:hypothetical protein